MVPLLDAPNTVRTNSRQQKKRIWKPNHICRKAIVKALKLHFNILYILRRKDGWEVFTFTFKILFAQQGQRLHSPVCPRLVNFRFRLAETRNHSWTVHEKFTKTKEYFSVILCHAIVMTMATKRQEYIPVGCVLPAAVAVCWAGGRCLPQCMLEYPPGVGLETPPRCGPGDAPWVWAWRPPPGQTPQLPPWVWAWRPARHAGIPPAMHAGIPHPPLWIEWQTGAKILPCPKLRLRVVKMSIMATGECVPPKKHGTRQPDRK